MIIVKAMWVPLAFFAPLVLGCVNILDKLIIDRHVPHPFVYPFYAGVAELLIALVVLPGLLGGGLEGPEWPTMAAGVGIGALRGFTLILLVAALRQGQVSRVVSIWFTSPIFVAIMAAAFLGESLGGLAWAAIVMAATGAVLVSWTGGVRSGSFIEPTVIFLALSAALPFALASVLTKHFLDDEVFWQLTFASRFGVGAMLLTLAFLPVVRNAAPGAWKTPRFMPLLFMVEALVPVYLVVYFAAVNLGPISLVAGIGAIQPIAVLLYSMALSQLSPGQFREWATPGTLGSQAAGTVLLATGVAIISVQ